jgi:hypothetical protein
MIRCITCNQALPEGREPPEYFGQLRPTMIEEGDIGGHSDDLDVLLDFQRSLYDALYRLTLADQETYLGEDEHEAVAGLARLGMALTQEIDRRIDALCGAGMFWRDLAKACGQKET